MIWIITQEKTEIGVVNGLVPWEPLFVVPGVALNICSLVVREQVSQVSDIGSEDLS